MPSTPDTLPFAEQELPDVIVPPEPSELLGQASTEVFTYTHQDGQEFSGTIEEARGACPALGRMSIEKARFTLQESDLATRIAERGREKRLAEPAKTNVSKDRSQKPEATETANPKKQPAGSPDYDYPARKVLESTSSDDEVRDGLEVQLLQTLSEPIEALQMASSATETDNTEVKNRTMIIKPSAVKPAQEIKAVPIPIREGAKAVVRSKPTIMHTEKPIELAASNEINNLIDHPTGTELILPVPAAPFVPVEEAVGQENSLDNIAVDTASANIVESLPSSIDEHGEPELDLPDLTETIDMGADHDLETDPLLTEEDNTIFTMAEFGPDETEIEASDTRLMPKTIAPDQVEVNVSEFTPAEVKTVVSMPELSAPVEELETTLVQLIDVMEAAEPEVSPVIRQILEEIITLPEVLETTHKVEEEEAIEQKLEELFIELFDAAAIEYKPQVVRSFVTLTRAHYFEELLLPTLDEKTQEAPDEIGTREFLQKLQRNLSIMQHIAIHLYKLGKSVLRLYRLDITLQPIL